MPDFTYGPAPVLVEETGEFAIGATGVLLATESGDPVDMWDLVGSPLPSILVGPKGAHQAFKADISTGVLDFGSVQLPAVSLEAQGAALEALVAADAAAASASSAAAAADLATEAALAAAASAAGGGGGDADPLVFARYVTNGASTTTPRPAGTGVVIWIGSVTPANMADGDVRISTS